MQNTLRNVINLKLTTEEENSQKALSAAEAGIEQSLIGKDATGQAFGTANIFQVTNQALQGTTFLLSNGSLINKDDGIDIWLTQYDSTNQANLYQPPYYTGTVSLYWGSQTDDCTSNTMAALEVILITANPDKNNPQLTRQALDPCPLHRPYNNFSAPTTGTFTIGGRQFVNKLGSINISNGLILRVIPLYANTYVGVVGTQAFPSQGKIITSTGAAGGTQRKIQYFQANDSLPSEFFYSLFSSN